MTKPRQIGRWLKRLVYGLLVFFLLAMGLLPLLPVEAAYLLLAGWIHYLIEVLPRVRFSGQVTLEAGIALGLAVSGLHFILSWWNRQRQGKNGVLAGR